MFRGKVKNIHFVGIGGSGMSGIAEVLLTMGFSVTGSDMKNSATVRRLRKLGSTVFIGHDPVQVDGVDVVVKSTAIPMSNPEIVAAEEHGTPVIRRAEMLSELMRMKYGVAVAGTHGKTTTTSMLATALHSCGLDPTIVIGGRLDSMGSSARLGEGEFMVAEADESDGTFMLLSPTIAIVTSVDPEHLEHWGDMDRLVDGFAEFANKVPFFGFAAVCLDHPTVQRLVPRLRRKVVTYGLSSQAEVRGENVRFNGLDTTFSVWWNDDELGELHLRMPGLHNVKNALAAVAVALELDLPFDRIATGLAGFTGVDRRFSVRHEQGEGDDQITIIDDYGHHPAEIRATLAAAHAAWPSRRVIAVVQPHRYTRVRDLFEDFARCFNDASEVVICPMYAAGEQPIEGIDHHTLATAVREYGHRSVVAVDSLDDATARLVEDVRPGDVVITLGAGNVNDICSTLGEALDGRG